MKLLFFDVETTGLGSKSIVWQVAYARAVQENTKLKVLEVVEIVGKKCIQSKEVKAVLEWAELLVAHNVSFEEKFLRYRGLPVPKESFCTMRRATPVRQIPNQYYIDDRGNVREWLNPYKWPCLSEAIEALGLEDRLRAICKNLTFHDALCDIYATVLLYAKLKNLELELDGHRIRRANSLRKYLTVRKYAIVNKEELLRSIASQNVFLKLLEKLFSVYSSVYERYKRWQWERDKEDIPF